MTPGSTEIRFRRSERLFIVGVPLAWAVILLFHPGGDGTAIFDVLKEDVTPMLVVHIGMMIFVPLFALAVLLLLRGIHSKAATVARMAFIPFVVLYVSWEALQGTGNGILVDQALTLSPAQQPVAADLIQSFAESPLVRDAGALVIPATLALVIAMTAAGVALRDVGAPAWLPVAFGFSGLLIAAHPPPYGPAGLILFAAVAVIVARSNLSVESSPESRRGGDPETTPAPFKPWERILILGVPIAWAIVLLFHPTGGGNDFYPIISDELSEWRIVHISTMVFVPLMAAVMFLLLRGTSSGPATLSRIALVVFGVVYLTWEVLIGTGNGVLVGEVNQLDVSAQPVGAALVEKYSDSGIVGALENVGTGALIVAFLAAGLALARGHGMSVAVPILLLLAAIPIAWHVTPFGQFGLMLFLVAAILVIRGRSSTTAREATPRPAAA